MRGSQQCTAVALEASCIIPTSPFLSVLLFSSSLAARTHGHTCAVFPGGADSKVLLGPNGVKQTVNQLQGHLSRGGSARLDGAQAPGRRGPLKTHVRRERPALKSARIYKHKYWPHNDDVRT